MITKLLNIGVTNSLDFEDKVRIKFLNSASLLFAAVLTYFIFYHLFDTELYKVALIQFVFLLSVPTTLWFQHKGKPKTARLALFIALHAIIFMTSMIVLVGHGNEYYYLATSVLILTQSKKAFWATFLVSINIGLYLLPHIYYPQINEHYKMVTAISVFLTTLLSVRFFMIIQKQYREQLKAQKEKLVELNMEKNDLMSIVAHDLKSPLAQIKGLVSILELESDKLAPDQIDLINKIKGVTANQHKQITSYLDGKALEEKVEEITYKNFDLVAIIKTVLGDMLTIAEAKNIQLIDNYFAPKINTYGSEDCVNKIISNLVSNAIKYSYPNTSINIDVKEQDYHLLISVKDEGQGFTKEDLEKVFLKNEVLSAKPTANETATGMGLYIVKKYVDILNGEIWIESNAGKGSVFFVQLPNEQF